MRTLTVGSVWKASDGRLVRIVAIADQVGGKIAVRNCETNRLSYMQRRYFENENAGVGWWLEPHTTPLFTGAPPANDKEQKA